MKQLQELLEQKRQQMMQLQRDVEALQRSIELMGSKRPKTGREAGAAVQEEPKATVRSGTEGRRARRRKKQGLSVPDAAEQILRDAERPLHVNEIAKRAADLGVQTRPAAIATALQRYVRLGRRFTRPEPNTFALAES